LKVKFPFDKCTFRVCSPFIIISSLYNKLVYNRFYIAINEICYGTGCHFRYFMVKVVSTFKIVSFIRDEQFVILK